MGLVGFNPRHATVLGLLHLLRPTDGLVTNALRMAGSGMIRLVLPMLITGGAGYGVHAWVRIHRVHSQPLGCVSELDVLQQPVSPRDAVHLDGLDRVHQSIWPPGWGSPLLLV